MRRHPLWTVLLWVFAGALPLLLTIAAATVANTFGCALDESGVHPCVIAGIDYGEPLAFMGIMFWFSMITFPMALAGGIVCLVACITKN